MSHPRITKAQEWREKLYQLLAECRKAESFQHALANRMTQRAAILNKLVGAMDSYIAGLKELQAFDGTEETPVSFEFPSLNGAQDLDDGERLDIIDE